MIILIITQSFGNFYKNCPSNSIAKKNALEFILYAVKNLKQDQYDIEWILSLPKTLWQLKTNSPDSSEVYIYLFIFIY